MTKEKPSAFARFTIQAFALPVYSLVALTYLVAHVLAFAMKTHLRIGKWLGYELPSSLEKYLDEP